MKRLPKKEFIYRAPTLRVIAPGVMLALVWLQTDQLMVLAVGQAVKVSPPVAPQPLTALGFDAKAVAKADVGVRPVMVTVAGGVQVLAAMALVGMGIWMLATGIEPPLAAGRTPVTSFARFTGAVPMADSLTPSALAGAAECRTPAVAVAGSLKR